jgi:hypothetical protein
MNEPLRQSAVMRWNLAFCAGTLAASWAFVSPRFAGSVALGALLETVNFRALWSHSAAVLGTGRPGALAVAGFGLRFVLLAGVLFVALRAGAHPVGLVLGLSIIVPSVLVAGWQARPQPGPPTPVPPPDDPSWDEWNPWLAREREAEEEED